MKLTVEEIAEAVSGVASAFDARDGNDAVESVGASPGSPSAEGGKRSCVQGALESCTASRAGELEIAPTNKRETALATGIAWDSRLVKPGDLYVALPGERADGHDFAAAAVAAGAVAVLATRPVRVDAPIILVDDAMRAVADLARFWRGRCRGVVVGLTGSNGKTTTKNLVRDVLSCAGSVVATRGNQNNELGVPATLLAADEDTDFIVVEMGMRGLGQIAELCDIARPDWGIVTNVGESHIELLGSRENIARAKSELLAALPQGGIAFVNASDEFLSCLLSSGQVEQHGVRIISFNGDVRAEGVTLDEEGRPSFTLIAAVDGSALPERDSAAGYGINRDNHASEDKREGNAESSTADRLNSSVKVELALRGMHNVSNACSAAAVGLAAGLALSQCAEALAAAQPEAGRQQVFRTSAGVTVVDDSYNANPDSMAASMRTFAAMDVKGRRIAVLGDMLELGGFAKVGHERMGALAASLGIDRLVCVGALSRDMARAAREAGMAADAVSECADAAAALAIVIPELRPGDAVLVKASHSIGLESVVEGLVG